MTRAQYRVYNRLAKKQVNRSDVTILETGAQYVTLHLAFPGLYLTYDNDGKLIATETEAERKAGNKSLSIPGKVNLNLGGEMGSENYGARRIEPDVHDDDVPF